MKEKVETRLAQLKAERERVARTLEYYDVVIAELEKLLDDHAASGTVEGTARAES